MQKFLCHLIQNSKFTFKEKYFIYQDGRGRRAPEGEQPSTPTAPASANAPKAPADAPDAPARREGEGDEAHAERTEAENPQSMFEALKGKVASLDSTIGKVIGNETYTKGLQQEAAQAKQALAQIQATMRTVNIEKVDMEALRAFEGQLSTIEGRTGKFQGEKEAANIEAKAKITTLRASLKQLSKDSYNGEKFKEAFLKNIAGDKDLPPEIIQAIGTRLDNEKFGQTMDKTIKTWLEMLDNADQATDPALITPVTTAVEGHLPQFTVDHFIKNTPQVEQVRQEIAKVTLATAFAVIASLAANKDLKPEEKAVLTQEIYQRAAKAIIAKKELTPAGVATASVGLPFPLNMLGVLAAGGKAAYDALKSDDEKAEPKTEETPEAKELREKREKITSLITRADAVIAKLEPITKDKEGATYTKGFIDKATTSYAALITKTAMLEDSKDGNDAAINALDQATLEAAESQIKATEDDEALTGEAIEANKAAKDQIRALTDQATEKETAMSADQVKTDIFAQLDIASLPEPLQKVLEARFPKDAITTDISAKFAVIKEKLSAADSLEDVTSLKTVLDEIDQDITSFTVESYYRGKTVATEILGDFQTNTNKAALWNDLKDLGGDGEQCKAAKAKVLADLVKAVAENGDFSLDEADNQILGAFVADVVSEKIKQKVTPEQIAAKITFRGISTPAKLDKTTKAILQALNSPALKGKVNLNWTASTNATPHEVAKTLAEHEEMLSGLNEYEEREDKGTIKVDNTNNKPELDAEGKPINKPGTFDEDLVQQYRELVKNAKDTKGTKEGKAAMKALAGFVKENKATLCAAGGHFDMATAVVRARSLRKLVYGKDAGVDTINEKVVIALTNRAEDVGKGELKSAGLSFSAPVKAEEKPTAEDVPAPESPPTAEEYPPVAGEPPPASEDKPAPESKPAGPAAEAPPAGESPPAAEAPKVGVPGFEDPAPNPDGGKMDPGFNEKSLNPDEASADTFGDEEPPAPEELDPNSPEGKALAQGDKLVEESKKIKQWYATTEDGIKVEYSFKDRDPQNGDFRRAYDDPDDPQGYNLQRLQDGVWEEISQMTEVEWKTYPSEGDKAAQPSDSPDDFSAERIEIGKVKIWRGDYDESYSSDTAKDNPKEGDLKRVADKAHEGHFHYYRFFMNKWQPIGNLNLYTGTYIAHGAPKPHEKIEKRNFRKTSLKGNEKKQFMAKISSMPEDSWLGESGAYQITEIAYTTPQPQKGDLKRIRPIAGRDIDAIVTTYYRYDGKKWEEIAKVDEYYDKNS